MWTHYHPEWGYGEICQQLPFSGSGMGNKIHQNPLYQRFPGFLLVLILALTSCEPSLRQENVPVNIIPTSVTTTQQPASQMPQPTPSPSQTATIQASFTPTDTQMPSATATNTATPTETPTPTITPTYAILRGKVLQQANCRYGPGAPYLYKYGVYPDTVLEIIGRTDAGTWVVVRAIGGTNPCWVKADLIEIRGDVMTVAPMYLELPRSPYYGAMTNVSARRAGDEVTVSWGGIQLRAGDDSEQTPYVIEAWICKDGVLVFTPVGSYGFSTKIMDEKGCSESSHGRISAAEKHGYTAWVEIPWPPHDEKP